MLDEGPARPDQDDSEEEQTSLDTTIITREGEEIRKQKGRKKEEGEQEDGKSR